LTKDCPKLESKDWEYVKSETRADPAELSYGVPPSDYESFEVDANMIFFKVD
jgi:hypothetical protein